MSNHKTIYKGRTKPLRIVLTGVENSGKSTLIKPLSERFNWPYILELCRTNEDVLKGEETFKTMMEIFGWGPTKGLTYLIVKREM